MGLLRIFVSGIPMPNEAWKPFLRFTVEDVKQRDVFMSAVNGSNDVHAACVECPGESLLSFQLGIQKTESMVHMASRIHRISVIADCLVVTQWAQDIKHIYTPIGQHVLFVCERVRESIRVCGNSDALGQWESENTEGQATLFIKKGLCVIPIALEEWQTEPLEFKLLHKKEDRLDWESPPFQNKSISLPSSRKDAIVWSKWGHIDTHITELPSERLTEHIRLSEVPVAADWSVRKSQSLPECPIGTPTLTYTKNPHTDASPAVLELASGDGGKGDVGVTADESFVDISWVFQEDETPLTKGKSGWPSIVRQVRRILLVFKCCRGLKSSAAEREGDIDERKPHQN